MRAAALLLACGCGLALAGAPETEDVRLSEGRALADTLGAQLRESLLTAMKDGGPVAAIDACRVEAPAIAERVGRDDVRIRRTALRVRNPGNAADADQRRILRDFERRLANGEAPDAIEQLDPTDKGGSRYMKAIVTQPMCATCHGRSIDPQLAAILEARYPADAATGFEPGSLRGAFVVEWSARRPAP